MLHCLSATGHSSLPMPRLHPLLQEGACKTEVSFPLKILHFLSTLPPHFFPFPFFSQRYFIFFPMLLPKKSLKRKTFREVKGKKKEFQTPNIRALSSAEQSGDLFYKEKCLQKSGKSRMLSPLSYKIVPHVIWKLLQGCLSAVLLPSMSLKGEFSVVQCLEVFNTISELSALACLPCW